MASPLYCDEKDSARVRFMEEFYSDWAGNYRCLPGSAVCPDWRGVYRGYNYFIECHCGHLGLWQVERKITTLIFIADSNKCFTLISLSHIM